MVTLPDLRIPRVVETPRRSMQRLGLLKLLVAISAKRSTSTLLYVGQELIRTLTSKVDLHWDDDLANYVRSALSEQTFPSVRQAAAQFLRQGVAGSPTVALEIQDAYLSQISLPSRRGRLAPTDDSRFPHWGVALGLTRKEPFGPLVRGNLLLSLVSEPELAAFTRFDPSCNPLDLSGSQRVFFLYTLLEKDLSVLIPLYEQLLERNGSFTDLEAGDMLPDLYLAASRALRRTGRGGLDADRATQMADTSSAIRARRGRSYGKTVREQTITPRLEPFVDMGLLSKIGAYSYEYEFTPSGRDFFSRMKGQWQASFSGFGKAAASLFNYDDRQVSSDEELLYLLHWAWDRLKSSLGYSPIDETLLLGLIKGLEEGAGWFELDEALETLKRLQKNVPGLLRFNIDRQGNLSVLRFMRDP